MATLLEGGPALASASHGPLALGQRGLPSGPLPYCLSHHCGPGLVPLRAGNLHPVAGRLVLSWSSSWSQAPWVGVVKVAGIDELVSSQSAHSPRVATSKKPRYPMSIASTPRLGVATVGTSKGCLHGSWRAGGNCSFPSICLTRRGAGVSHVSDTTCIYATVLPAGYAGANRRRPGTFLQGWMLSRGTACATVLPACRASAACPAHHISRLVGEAWGPRPTASNRLGDSRTPYGCTRWYGGGSHRLRRPGRVHLSPHNRGINTAVPRARCLVPQRCPRLDTAPSACWCQQE